MKKIVLILIIVLVSKNSFSQTYVGGTINSSTTWAATGNPYIIQNELIIASGVTLSIKPGVVLKFMGTFGITVNGTLKAIGNSDSMILFRDDNFIQSYWGSILFNDGAQDYNPVSQSGCMLQYCNLQLAGDDSSVPFLNSESAVFLSGCSPSIDNCIFYECLDGCILEQGAELTSPVQISNNKFINDFSSVNGVLWLNSPNTTVSCNLFYQCDGNPMLSLYGTGSFTKNIIVHCSNSGATFLNPQLDSCTKNTIVDNSLGCGQVIWAKNYFGFNTITRNDLGGCTSIVVNSDSTTKIMNNNLYNNTGGFSGWNFYEVNNAVVRQWYYTPATSGMNNWFDKTTTNSIDSIIFDYNDDTALTHFSYQPFLASPDTTAPETPPTGVVKSDVGGGNIQITWNPNPDADLAGYKVYWGTFNGYSFTNSVDVGNVTTYILSGANIGDSIGVTAYDHEASNINDQCECHESWFTPAQMVTAVADPKQDRLFNFFPNPANEMVIIKYNLPVATPDAILEIRNLKGSEVKWVRLAGGEAEVTIPVSDLQNGIYTIQLTAGGRTSTPQKIAIVR